MPARTPLQQQLDAITANTRSLVQPDRLAITDNAVQDLLSSGLESRALAVGSPAPAFALPAANNKVVRSSDLLALGPVIVTFFRGRWCPYCMTELEAWQQLYPEIRARGALLVAISPQLPRQNDFTVQHHHLSFPLLTDARCELAAAFGVAYTVTPPMRAHYRSILINIPFINGGKDPEDTAWRLPLPATFIIGQSGAIAFAEAYADHRVRPDPQDVLAALGH